MSDGDHEFNNYGDMFICTTCNYWSGKGKRFSSGWCCRYPPRVVADNGFSAYPTVKQDMFCGEHTDLKAMLERNLR